MNKTTRTLLIILMFFALTCKKDLTAPLADNFRIKSGVMDRDGNSYRIVKIGNQWWMAENLKVTRYRNGDAIPHVMDEFAWSELTTDAYCNYDNNETNATTYGRLYNWWAVNDPRNIAPEGWHVPSDAEWKQLEMHLGMSQSQADSTGFRGMYEGGKLKEKGTAHWRSPNAGASDEYGFTALSTGYRLDHGGYSSIGYNANFWSSTESGMHFAWSRHLHCTCAGIARYAYYKRHGLSVRCVRDN